MTSVRTKYLLAIPFFYFLSVYGLSTAGLLGPDEPRYASIGRQMAESGDWITPNLWGSPWFEKPPLLYWMAAAGFTARLGPELAPRLPVALMSIAFVVFFFLFLKKHFGERAAFYAAGILSTCAGWVAFSHAAATDLPLAATFGGTVLLSMRWLERGGRSTLVAAAVLLGLGVLAKGLVPLVLIVPLFWFGRRRLADLALFLVVAGAVAAPWYLAVTARHGSEFIDEFFLKHHFERFSSESLKHVRPFWFYVPVLFAGLFPWSPAAFLLAHRRGWTRERLYLLVIVLWGLVFFSASTNKLPGYMLPLFPPLAALIGIRLAEVKRTWAALAASAALLALVPITGAVLPRALESGLSRANWNVSWAGIGVALLLSVLVGWVAARRRGVLAFSMVLAGSLAGIVYLKMASLPQVDVVASARPLWVQVKGQNEPICVGAINRTWRYGLNYYSRIPLPDCAESTAQVQVDQLPGNQPAVRRR